MPGAIYSVADILSFTDWILLRYLLIPLLFLAGTGLAVQAAANAQMRAAVGSPPLSSLINFTIGGIALALATLTGLFGRAHLANAPAAPWWAWIGGLFGAVYVTLVLVAVPKIGTAAAVTAAIFGQLIGAMILDQFGWLGVPRIPLNPWRILGAVLVLAGVFLMQRR